jgi:hypothetical protein
MKKKNLIIISILIIVLSSCSIYDSIMNFSKLNFKLGSVNNFKVGNIALSNKSKLSDFGAMDIVNLTSQVMSGKFPVTFTVNVLAQNPNSSKSESSMSAISLEKFPWTLYINDKKTISGNISNPVKVPAVEDATIIPLEMSLNLTEFFKDDGLNNLLNLALSLGGSSGSTANIKLVAEPVLGTPLGNLSYPTPLTIIDKNFTSEKK